MLRKGTKADFDDLYEIYMDKSVNPFLGFETMSKTEFLPVFDELTSAHDLYVYELDGKIAATCRTTRYTSRRHHVASLETIATNPTFQRRGIGTTFILEVLEVLKKSGVKRIELSYEADNPKTGEFYQKLGFKHEGTFKDWFKRAGEDHYIDEHFMALLFD